MVRRVLEAGNAILPDLRARGEVEDGVNLQLVLRVEDVVQGLDVFAILTDLPGGVRGLFARGGVGGAESEDSSNNGELILKKNTDGK